MHKIEKRLVYCDVVYKMYKTYPGFCDTISAVIRHGPTGPGPGPPNFEGPQIHINYIIYKIWINL